MQFSGDSKLFKPHYMVMFGVCSMLNNRKNEIIGEFNILKSIARNKFFPNSFSNEVNYKNLPRELWPRYTVRYFNNKELDVALLVQPRYAHVKYVFVGQNDMNNIEPLFGRLFPSTPLKRGEGTANTLVEQIRKRILPV